MVVIHEEAMDIHGVETFVAKEQAVSFKVGEPMLKAWLIRSRIAGSLYVVVKHSHCISDGLDML